jgi:ABC-2 type transport system permease protein
MKRNIFSDIYTVYLKEMKDFFKNKSSILISVIQPVIWLILMGYGMSGLTSNNPYIDKILNGAPNYITFLTSGIIVMTALNGGLYGGVSLLTDIIFGYITKLLSSPISRKAIILGKAASVLIQTLAQILVIIILSLILGIRYRNGIVGILLIIVISMLFTQSMVAISLFLSMKYKTHSAIYTLISFITLPLLFTSNAVFPTYNMPKWLSIITKINPITYAVDPIRGLMLGNYNILNMVIGFSVTLGLAIILTSITIYSFGKKFGKI